MTKGSKSAKKSTTKSGSTKKVKGSAKQNTKGNGSAAPKMLKPPSFPIVIFDTETTGLTKNRTVRLDMQPEVIEFFGRLVDLDDGRVLAEYETIIKPGIYPMSDRTIHETKTKLSNDLLKDAPRFSEVADKIHDFLAQPQPGNLAHNLSFDRDMIEIELERLGRKIEWPILSLCTVEQTIHLRGRRMRLIQLHEYLFNEGFEGAHRAKEDVDALTRIAVELRKRGVI
jgi:DNA polymerase III alpha subunit (gram-positive type)